MLAHSNQRIAVCTLVIVAALAGVARVDEPAPARPAAGKAIAPPSGKVDTNDPLLKALQELQGEIEQLRRDVRQPGSMKSPPAAMPLPAITAPRTAAPAAVTPRKASIAKVAADTVVVQPPSTRYDLWSFQPLTRPQTPQVRDQAWGRDELDRFILARLEAANLKPNADADHHTLLRRVAYDLTGLPPSPAEIAAFCDDPSPLDAALARAVDGYLASPRFGERWGRHWLDVARYADSVGRTWNAPFTYAWRYRNYVVDAFNADKPYDRFVAEQLAGDLLPADSLAEQRENLIATGFLALGSLALNDGRGEGFIMDRVDDQIDVTSRAFFGLTVACARCHDHKYDPVSMRDYYALAGIFYSAQTLSGQTHQRDMAGGGYVDEQRLILLPVSQSDAVGPSGIQPGVHSMNGYREEWQRVDRAARYTTHPDLAMGALEGEIRDCELRTKGDPYEREEAPPRGDVRIPGLPAMPPIADGASGRLELARWIASPEHPLTARVAANRVWSHLFGRGLVRSVDNFGTQGEQPSHPELLDHLAARFIASGWSTKGLIRSIVLSRTYRLSSAGLQLAKQRDPGNELYWRGTMRRLELEAIRDSLLLAAGRLEHMRPESIQVAGMGGKGRGGVVRSLLDTDAPYRTVYLPVLRSLMPELYSTFDFSDPCQIAGQREVTTVAPQALYFMNGGSVIACAQAAAEELLRPARSSDADRVATAYLRLLSRPATADEIDAALDLMNDLNPPASARDPRLHRWTTFVQALLASAEFRYLL